MNVQPGPATHIQAAGLQTLADHARFHELLPGFHGLPAPPRFHFGTFPAALAAFHYSLSHLGPAGVWESDALIVGPGLLLRSLDGAFVKALELNWSEHDIEVAIARMGVPANATPQPLDADAVLMVTAGYPIYGHWLADILPRLILLERAGHPLDRLTFLIPADTREFALRLLDIIGIGAQRLHFLTGPIRPKRLLMPTFPHNGRQFMALAEDGFQMLQSRIAARFGRLGDAGTPARILVSRQGYGSRPLQNRVEFEALALEYGFATVAPQNLPLIEQVQLFASARAVLGEYGSGLHNTIFSPPGTVVGAIRGPLGHPVFLQSGIGDALRQPTGYVFGTCGDHIDHPDFRVELDSVRDCLRAVFPAGHTRTAMVPVPAVASPAGIASASAAQAGAGPAPAIMPASLNAENALQTYRDARTVGNWELALAAGRLLRSDGDDVHGVSAALADLCRRMGRTAEAVNFAVAALANTPGDSETKRLLAAILPAKLPSDIAGGAAIQTRLLIDFRNDGNAAAMLGKGWGRNAPKQRWMVKTLSTLHLPPLDPRTDWVAELDASPYRLPARLRILLDWVEVRRFTLTTKPKAPLGFRIPAEVLAGVQPHTLHFDHPDACTPRSVDGRDDDRQLAFGTFTLLLVPAEPAV